MTIKKVSSEHSLAGDDGQVYPASGKCTSMRLWCDEQPTNNKPSSKHDYEVLGSVTSDVHKFTWKVRWCNSHLAKSRRRGSVAGRLFGRRFGDCYDDISGAQLTTPGTVIWRAVVREPIHPSIRKAGRRAGCHPRYADREDAA